jgi:SHAQKYF class myb-like DNA-binding protein
MAKTKIKFFCSLQKKENKKQGRWSQEEQDRFLKGCYFFKNDWEKIKDYIKTRTIPQIRSHAQKYLIKICRKYSIKLTKKKFSNRLSKHLDITKLPYKGKTNISNMSIYEKNILEMFNYYNRELIQDDKYYSNNNSQCINIPGFKDYNSMSPIPIYASNVNNSVQGDLNNNLIEKEIKNENSLKTNENLKDLKNDDNFLSPFNNYNSSINLFSPKTFDILPTIQNGVKPNTNNTLSFFLQNPNNQNLYNQLLNSFNYPIKKLDLNYPQSISSANDFNQNKYLIQNEYEFHLMQKISYYNNLLLNYIKSNQKINQNILVFLGFNPKENDTNVNNIENNNRNNLELNFINNNNSIINNNNLIYRNNIIPNNFNNSGKIIN